MFSYQQCHQQDYRNRCRMVLLPVLVVSVVLVLSKPMVPA
jgi:hypothetical protein